MLSRSLSWARVVVGLAVVGSGIGVPKLPAAPAWVTAQAAEAAVRIAVESRGGMLIPAGAAVVNLRQGAAALTVQPDAFPSIGTVLEWGNGGANHVAISESINGTSSARAHFRLEVWSDGKRQKIEGPVVSAGVPCLLAFSYSANTFTFWVNGQKIGSVPGRFTLQPDRLALIEPTGLRWRRFAVWAAARDFASAAATEPEETPEVGMTFLSNRHREPDGTQAVLFCPALMDAAAIKAALDRPAARREVWVDLHANESGGDGTAEHPFRTIAQAVQHAGPGVTITVAPGTYRESVVLTTSGTVEAPLILRASPTGPVTLEGADPLDGFQPAGTQQGASVWVKRAFHSRDVPCGSDEQRRLLAKIGTSALKQLERRGRVDAVWCDGALLPKAESRGALRPFSFWVDVDHGELLVALRVNDRPENHRFELGARGPLISGLVSHVQLKGFRLLHDDSPIGHGAIDLDKSSSDWQIENIEESGGNWCGIRLGGWGHVLRHNLWDNNGDDGIDGSLIQYAAVEGDTARFNNWQRGISPSWGSGGVKLTQVEHMLFRDCEFAFNLGTGIWFDCNNTEIVVEGCRCHHNMTGIFMEISPGPFIFRDNVCFANDGSGIAVGESVRGLIDHNTLVGNKTGIDLRNIHGRNADYPGAGLGLVKAGAFWSTADITIRRNVIAHNTVAGISNTAVRLDPNRDRINSDTNQFFRNATLVSWPAPADNGAALHMDESNDWAIPEAGGGARLNTLAVVRRLLGLEQHSTVADPHFSYPSAYEYETETARP